MIVRTVLTKSNKKRSAMFKLKENHGIIFYTGMSCFSMNME